MSGHVNVDEQWFANRLKALMGERGMTQTKLAEECNAYADRQEVKGLSRSAVAKYAAASMKPSMRSMNVLAGGLGITVEELLEGVPQSQIERVLSAAPGNSIFSTVSGGIEILEMKVAIDPAAETRAKIMKALLEDKVYMETERKTR